MNKLIYSIFFLAALFLQVEKLLAWEDMPMPELHVEGRYLKDSHGHIVNLHGFAQTFSPWFNEQNSKWNNYDVAACLNYNKEKIDEILAAGWMMNFVRMHMDPYWSSIPGCQGRYEGEECYSETRFRKYLDEVFVPLAEYAVSKGLYVVMRPPGVCPEKIEVGGVYHEFLINVWSIVAKHPVLMNHPHIMFELANEPIHILGPDGTYGAGTQGHFDNLKIYFQTIVDTIRTSADNILWIPGLGYQSLYAGFAVNPIEGDNIGYAVHVYPGWFNSGQGYIPFQQGWERQVQPVADFAPIMVTEMDWAPEHHKKSWGKGVTGTAGGDGFGANFKKIADDCGNVSWLLFTEPHLLAQFGNPDAPPDVIDFLTDPEACPLPIYNWYKEYAADYDFTGTTDDYLIVTKLEIEGGDMISVLTNNSLSLKVNAIFADGHIENVSSVSEITVDNSDVINVERGRIFALKDGQASVNVTYTDQKGTKMQVAFKVVASTFPLKEELFNPRIWADGTFDETTKTLHTGQWGFGGWQYQGIDLSEYKYIVARLGSANTANIDFRVFDGSSYWGSPVIYKFGNSNQVVVPLATAVKEDGSALNAEHIYIVGFWSNGSNPFVIDTVFLSNSGEYDPPAVFAADLFGNEIVELTGFQYEPGFGPSAAQTIIVSGESLTGNIEVSAPAHFEVSTDSTSSFSSTVTLVQSSGLLAEVEVYVRMKAGLLESPGESNLTVKSKDASTKTIILSGTVGPLTNSQIYGSPNARVVSTMYYSISGQQFKSIENMSGIFIVKQQMSDGTVTVSKIIQRK